MTDKAILDEMAARKKAISDAVKSAQEYADEHGLQFRTSLADGEISATYYGTGHEERESYDDTQGWYSSFFSY